MVKQHPQELAELAGSGTPWGLASARLASRANTHVTIGAYLLELTRRPDPFMLFVPQQTATSRRLTGW